MKTTSLSRPLALLLALGFMPLALSARHARAQDASLEDPAEAAETEARASARFDEGVEHLRAERFDEAAAAFRESYRLAPRVETMCNLAVTYDRSGASARARAVRAYRACGLEDRTGRFGPYAQRRAGELERELALEDTPLSPIAPEAEETAPEEPAPATPPAPTEDRTPIWVAGAAFTGVGALALVPAIVLAQSASDAAGALEREHGTVLERGSDAHRQLEAANRDALAATALYIGAGIAGATGLTLLVLAAALPSGSEDVALAVVPTPAGVAGTIAGRF